MFRHEAGFSVSIRFANSNPKPQSLFFATANGRRFTGVHESDQDYRNVSSVSPSGSRRDREFWYYQVSQVATNDRAETEMEHPGGGWVD